MDLHRTLYLRLPGFLLCTVLPLAGCESKPQAGVDSGTQTTISQAFPSPEEAALWAFLQPPKDWEDKMWKPYVGSGVNKTATLAFYRNRAVRCDLNRDGKKEWLFDLNRYVDQASKDGGSFGLEGTSGIRKWTLVQQTDHGYVVRHIEHHLSLPQVYSATTNGWNDLVVIARGVRDDQGVRRGSTTKLTWKADGTGYESSLTMPIRTQDGPPDEGWAAFLKKAKLGNELPYLWN